MQVAEAVTSQPVFDPDNVGASLDVIKEQVPISRPWLAGTVLGETVSRRKGAGQDTDGVRDYVPLDDPRHIDWRITARQPNGTLQVRDHFQDVTPTLWIVTDALRPHNAFEVGHFSEQRLALSATMALLRMAQLQGMPTAVIAADDRGLAFVQRRAGQGRSHMIKTATGLAEATKAEDREADERYSLAELLGYAGRQCRESVVAVVSDFRDADPEDEEHGWRAPLEQLIRKGNDIIAIEPTNPWDLRLPEEIDRFIVDGRTVWVGNDKAGRRTRDKYEVDGRARQRDIDKALAGNKVPVPHIRLSAAQPLWRDSFCDQLRALA